MEAEIDEVLRFSINMLKTFGFGEIRAYLATRPEKSVGENESWERAQESLKKSIEKEGIAYEIDPGGGAFYGPKIDLKITDALKREWQLTTIQFDFNLPERFDMTFVDTDGKEKRPFVVHRALLGSIERFFGILIEHYGGAFPVWLAPVQAAIVPVAETFNSYGAEVAEELKRAGIRVELDSTDQRMNAKIRNAQKRKIPYMLIVGEREAEGRQVSVRYRSGEQENGLPLDSFLERIQKTIIDKSNEEANI